MQKENRGGRLRLTPLAIVFLLAAAAGYLLLSHPGSEADTGREAIRNMTAEELAAADETDFQRELERRAGLDACYKRIAQNFDLYPRELLVLALQNSEAAQFVADYPEKAGERLSAEEIDISGDMAGGGLPHLLQWDERWGYAPYGSSIVAVSGCGPACLSMVAAGLTGNAGANPLAVADYSAAQGWYYEGQGTDWELMRSGAEHFGLRWRELPLDAATMCAALDGGEPIIASMGPGDFTDSGHYIVFRGYETEGFRILDPNSNENTGLLWPFSRLKSQIRNLWAYSV